MIDKNYCKRSLEKHGYTIIREIGSGGYATCYAARDKKYQEEFAIKAISLEGDNKISALESYCNEIEALKKLIHPNIVSIYNYFREGNFLFVVLEYCSKGSLKDLIESKVAITKVMFLKIAKQIIQALEYVHSLNIAHRDIKPANIFIDVYDRPKIGDFGISQFIDQKTMCHTYNGSWLFLAPEVINKKPHNPLAADIWSLGVTLYCLYYGRDPWTQVANSKVDITNMITYGQVHFPANSDTQIAYLLSSMMKVNPDDRATAEQLLSRPVFQEQIATSVSQGRIISRKNSLNCKMLSKNISIMQSRPMSLKRLPIRTTLQFQQLFPAFAE